MTALSEAQLPAINHLLSHPKYRPDIDGLRAIAVLSVVAFHAFPSLIQGGFVGVDIFFVISGFLISSIIFGGIEKNNFSFIQFYSRRVNRIFPALLLVLAATWGFGWFSLLAEEYAQLGKHIAGGSAFISNFVLLGEAGYFDSSAETKPLLHLWSLGIEEQFYLVWPLMIWAAWRIRLNIIVLVTLIAGLSFALNVLNVETAAVDTFYSPQTRFWELLVGSSLAYANMHKDQLFPAWRGSSGPIIRNIQSMAGLTLLVAAFALTTKNNQFPGYWALLPTIGAALLIAAGPFAWFNKAILSSRLLVWIGLISFPLYLWHWPLLTFAKITSGETPSAPARLAAVGISIILAWLTYRCFERPIRNRVNSMHAAIVLTAVMLGVGITGYATLKLGGFPSRFPAEIQSIADFKYEFAEDGRYPECWLAATDAYNGFAGKCLTDAGNKPGEGILIWGDSHSARLYPGVAAAIGDKIKVLQATRSSCPPILGFGDAVCSESNAYILASIAKVRPEMVILFGAWGRYGTDWSQGSEKRKQLLHTINEIKLLGINNIVVLGPSPEWTDTLPKLVYQSWKNDYPRHRIPSRLNGLNPETEHVDSDFRAFIPDSGVTYVSLYDLLCTVEGCITHIDRYPAKLMSWDYGHLTTEGAKLIAEKLIALKVLVSAPPPSSAR